MASQLASPAAHQSSKPDAEPQQQAEASHVELPDPGEGWETRPYIGGTQTDVKALPVKSARIRLDAGQGAVAVSVVSWIDSIRAKMAAGR